jgi:sugar lactone lactonase YvrE
MYVCHYDVASSGTAKGLVSVISPAGKLLREIEAPAPELTGVTLNAEGTILYLTESSTNTVYGLTL